MSRLIVFTGAALVLACAPAQAQSWEVSGLAGYTPTVELDRTAPELEQLDLAGGFTWGAQVARFFSPHFGAEVLWTLQRSGLEVGTEDGTADLFTLTVGQLHGNAVYRFARADAPLQPFVFGGLGVTFFRADDLPSETKLSLGFGGGVNYFPRQSAGLRGQFRYKPTLLNDESAGDFCDPFGFCQDTLQQIELVAGVVLRF
jgi:hypothetical protein